MVAYGTATNSVTGCKRILYDMRRYTNSQHIGTITYQHSRVPSTVYANLNASGSGFLNQASLGTMLYTSEDNCFTTGRHVMDWYTPGAASQSLGRNTGHIPPENDCWDNCMQIYYYLQSYEYTWSFWS